MKSFLILLLVVAVASAAKTHQKRETRSANLNNYVDNVIANLQNFITENSLNSLALPNVTQSFSVKPLLITYSGRLSLYNGILDNLSSVRRYGDVEVTYDGKILNLAANLGIDKVTVGYTYSSKLFGMTASGTADGSVAKVDTGISLTADLEKYTAALDYFQINSLGSISASLHGNSVTDWFATAILNLVLSIIKNDVATEIDSSVTESISDGLAELNSYIATLLEA